MQPATAALIGAGVAAGVSLLAQFVGHELDVRRDRRNQRRERLYDVIVAAAIALYEPIDRPSEQSDQPPPKPGTIAATLPFLRDPSMTVFLDSFGRAIVVLQVHFGHDHALIDSYTKAFQVCAKTMEAKVKHLAKDSEDDRTPAIPGFAHQLLAAQRARDEWMRGAIAHVDAI